MMFKWLIPILVFSPVFAILDTASLNENSWVSVWQPTDPLTINGSNWTWENDLNGHPFFGLFIMGPGHVIHPQDCYFYPFDPLKNKWMKTNPPVRPPRTCLGTHATGSQDTAIFYLGGAEGAHQFSQGGFTADYRSIDYNANRGAKLWVYEFNRNRWHHMKGPHELPPIEFNRFPRYDPLHDVTITVQGSQTWLYNFHNNKAVQIANPTSFPQRKYQNAADTRRGLLYVLMQGGMWALNPDSGRFTSIPLNLHPGMPLTTDGTILCHINSMDYDPLHDVLFYVSDSNMSGLPRTRNWIFHCDTRQWEEVFPDSTPRDFGRVAYNRALNCFMQLGVYEEPRTGGSPTPSGIWMYRYRRGAPAEAGMAPAPTAALTTVSGTVKLSWNAVAGASGYNVYRGDADPYPKNFRLINGAPLSETAFTDPSASLGTAYAYRVCAVMGGKEGFPSRILYTTPGRVLGVRASVEESTVVKVSWIPNPEPDITGYNIYRARGTGIFASFPGVYVKVNSAPVIAAEFLDTISDLTDGIARGYIVKAVNGFGLEGGLSPECTTFPDCPDYAWTLGQNVSGQGLKMAFRWQPPERTKILGVNLYRMTSPPQKQNTALITDSVTYWTMPPAIGGGASEGITQTYTARAVNLLGQQGFASDQVSPANNDYGYGMVPPNVRYNNDEYLRDAISAEVPALSSAGPLLIAGPNPFNPTVRIHYAAFRADRPLLRIYDAGGRLIRDLSPGLKPGLPGSLSWDGRDMKGRFTAPGLYILRLSTPQSEISRKLILAR